MIGKVLSAGRSCYCPVASLYVTSLYSKPDKLFLCVFQAMRFPPKSYNKDLESAEVRISEDSF